MLHRIMTKHLLRRQKPQPNIQNQLASKSTTTSPLRPWSSEQLRQNPNHQQQQHPFLETHGDYRTESHLEQQPPNLPLYQHQSTLPRLPIPTINETISRFLPTALPLATSESEAQSLIEACRSFPQQASILQEKLQQRKEESMKDSSWLQKWWNTEGYLKVRDPVVVNVSYFFHFEDDPTIITPTSSSNDNSNKYEMGIKRGASILHSLAQYHHSVCNGTLPPDVLGKKKKTPLCSTAFKYMFHSCRIPRIHHDTVRLYDPYGLNHCIVACRGRFYALDFLDAEKGGESVGLHVIEERLNRCVEMAENDNDENEVTKMMGYLTGWDRDSWAEAREEMIRSVGLEKMERALGVLESGAILLCLDDHAPISRKQCANTFWTGGTSSGHNRWFDKSIQIICTSNGKAGLLGEHSMMDGMPVIGLADCVTKVKYGDWKKKEEEEGREGSGEGGVHDIFGDCYEGLMLSDSKFPEMAREAKEDFFQLINTHQLNVLCFRGYGSNMIKKMGYSPDAYVQMAMQLATYRLFQKQVGTYEAIQVRPFLHGRTETARAVSPSSSAFITRMGLTPRNDELSDMTAIKEKVSLLKQATESHVKYVRNASMGHGVDRHFFGLGMICHEEEQSQIEQPDLFSHPLFVRSKRWRVSTSHLSHPRFENWGYGEVVPDGVGLSYMIKDDCCLFNVTALKKNKNIDDERWSDGLCYLLEEALVEMKLLNDMQSDDDGGDEPLVSKL